MEILIGAYLGIGFACGLIWSFTSTKVDEIAREMPVTRTQIVLTTIFVIAFYTLTWPGAFVLWFMTKDSKN